ncbi:adenosine kinase [Actinocrispum sp. NPDC049592]|uniref:adenosine kinase n=1 Tax=Actinocrispum sp. NPDC049592 TaxID=3154835 RepID=UPI00343AE7B3
MTPSRLDILGIGNAVLDIFARVDDTFLEAHDLVKGSMTLVDADQAHALHADLSPIAEISGGSVANSMVVAASLGARVAYVGKVRDDDPGDTFARDTRSAGVGFQTAPTTSGAPTARCIVMVTPDGERTMCTFLGACAELGPEDIDAGLVSGAAVTYLEGYLWDRPRAKDAFRLAMSLAHSAGRKIALTLSDSFCVERHRAEFLALIRSHVDVLFTNEDEARSLYEVATVEEAISRLRDECEILAVTRGENGSYITHGDDFHAIPAQPTTVVDTTGAGDAYAAGFLHALTQGEDLETCARLGSTTAARIISHIGSRPLVALS